MKRNWLQNVAIVASLTISTVALAENRGGFKLGNLSNHSSQGSSQMNSSRLSNFKVGGLNLNNGSQNGFRTQISNLGSLNNRNLNQGIKLGNLTTNKNTQILSRNNSLGNLLQNSNATKLFKTGAAGAVAQACVKPGCIDPGFNNHCHPCKIGCQPWWWGCNNWCGPCYSSCYTNYYPVYYTQPIMVPVSVPVVTQTVTTAVTEIAPVAAAVEEKVMQVPAGSTLTLQAQNLGDAAGQVVLQLDKLAMPMIVNEWKAEAVTTTLPPMGLVSPLKAEIIIVNKEGKVASNVKIELVPAQPQQPQGQPQATGAITTTASAR